MDAHLNSIVPAVFYTTSRPNTIQLHIIVINAIENINSNEISIITNESIKLSKLKIL